MWIFQFPGLFCEYVLWWVIKCSSLATIVLNCCNGILYFNLKWDCIPVLTACSIINSWFWNAAMTSVNYINQDMRKRQCHCSLTWNNVIFCVLAQARLIIAVRPEQWLCRQPLRHKHHYCGIRSCAARMRAAECNSSSVGSNCYLIKPKAKFPVMITGSELGQTPLSWFFWPLFLLLNAI